MKAYARLLLRTSSTPSLNFEGLRGLVPAEFCDQKEDGCRGKSFHHTPDFEAVCVLCGTPWPMVSAMVPRGHFSNNVRYDQRDSLVSMRATLSVILERTRRLSPGAYRAAWLYIVEGYSYPGVLREGRRRYPQAARSWNRSCLPGLVKMVRTDVERRLEKAGLIHEHSN